MIRSLARIDDLRAKAIWPDPQVKEAVKVVFTALRDKIKSGSGKLAFNPAVTRESAGTSLRLIRLAPRARLEYDAVKDRRRGLDFDDLLVRSATCWCPRRTREIARWPRLTTLSSCWSMNFKTPTASRVRFSGGWETTPSSIAGCSWWVTRSSQFTGSEARSRPSSIAGEPNFLTPAGSV